MTIEKEIKPEGFKPEKSEPALEKKDLWEDIYGETLIEFKPDKVKITERKTGEVTEQKKEEVEDPYYHLNEFERRRVNEELKKFEVSKEAQILSPSEHNEIFSRLREKLSKRILELREKNKK